MERYKKSRVGSVRPLPRRSGALADEKHAAADLVASFVNLVEVTGGMVPSAERVRELGPWVMQVVRREEGWRGTLDEVNFRAVKESTMVKDE